jgi:hypothetical protein
VVASLKAAYDSKRLRDLRAPPTTVSKQTTSETHTLDTPYAEALEVITSQKSVSETTASNLRSLVVSRFF